MIYVIGATCLCLLIAAGCISLLFIMEWLDREFRQ